MSNGSVALYWGSERVMRRDGTKRYRVFTFDFDARANFLGIDIRPEWEPSVQEQHRRSQAQIHGSIVYEYGERNSACKIDDFRAFGAVPWSVVAFHNVFFRQIHAAFVSGAYYPALTSACALGERILNHLIIRLRKYYTTTPQYKRVHGRESFDNWSVAISTLEAWKVLRGEAATEYERLRILRNKAIHFRPDLDANVREQALAACKSMSRIIERQFGACGTHPWFIPCAKGASFISAEWEHVPFVKEVYLPNCVRVGPCHRVECRDGEFVIADDPIVSGHDSLDDGEYIALFNAHGR